jgi:mannose-1-phosphate guanylyltransferase
VESGKSIGTFENFQAYELKAFKEKPTAEVAQDFLKRGGFSWNSGMFIWKVDVILEKFKMLMPDLFTKLIAIHNEIGVDHASEHFRDVWSSITPETIDYGIMEKSDRCAILPAGNLGWNDVGSWDSLFEVIPADANGNILIHARHIGFNTQNSLIYSSDQTD